MQFSINAAMRRKESYEEYILNYKTCKNCSCCLLFEYKQNSFCTKKCAATYNNKIRKESGWERSKESKEKVSASLISYHDDIKLAKYGFISPHIYDKSCTKCAIDFITHSKNKKLCDTCTVERKTIAAKLYYERKLRSINKNKFSKVLFKKCLMCENIVLISYKKRSQTCSKACQSKIMSIKASERLRDPNFRKDRYGRHKMSYMEKSFMEWLDSKNIIHEHEKHFFNHEINKHYFTDFYFENLKLVIELDGTQHRKTIEKDMIRDEFLTRVHGLTVVRVTHKQYIKKERLEEIKTLLGVS